MTRVDVTLGMKAIISEKGQVTIPKALRDSLALAPGTALDFCGGRPVAMHSTSLWPADTDFAREPSS